MSHVQKKEKERKREREKERERDSFNLDLETAILLPLEHEVVEMEVAVLEAQRLAGRGLDPPLAQLDQPLLGVERVAEPVE